MIYRGKNYNNHVIVQMLVELTVVTGDCWSTSDLRAKSPNNSIFTEKRRVSIFSRLSIFTFLQDLSFKYRGRVFLLSRMMLDNMGDSVTGKRFSLAHLNTKLMMKICCNCGGSYHLMHNNSNNVLLAPACVEMYGIWVRCEGAKETVLLSLQSVNGYNGHSSITACYR